MDVREYDMKQYWAKLGLLLEWMVTGHLHRSLHSYDKGGIK